MWLIVLLFAASIGLAFYHVGVEQHWFAGPTACTGGYRRKASRAICAALLDGAPAGRCDEPQWTLFGVSLAGWNLLASLAARCVFGSARRRGAGDAA